MLNFIYYPVSFILWVWHKAFGYVLGESSGVTWALAVVFLVFTLRAILYKPFVGQVRSMRKMQEFQPEIAKLRKKYANDKQKQTEEMQRLQKEHGVNPLGGCLPIFVQVPVFIGLFHVLREFNPILINGAPRTENYFFDAQGVQSFNEASFFGAKLGAWVTQGDAALRAVGTSVPQMIIVMIPLMIAAGVFTHITARHSVARQTAAQGENPQTAIMNKLMLYIFPIGVVVGAPFLPLAVLLYWVSNNLWTLGQQYVVYRRIDEEESAKRDAAVASQQARAPRPGQKPVRPEPPVVEAGPAKTPGAKPVTRKAASSKPAGSGKPAGGSAAGNGSGGNGSGKANLSKTNVANVNVPKANGSKADLSKSVEASGAVTDGVQTGKTPTTNGTGSPNGSRPPVRRGRKRR